MPMYHHLRWKIEKEPDRKRAIRNLQALRKQLAANVPAKDQVDTLLLATWNIRDFGKANRRGWGDRLHESWFYIAEVISRFDFVAVQEINQLAEWQQVMDILGPDWDYIATDTTDRMLGGNGERMAFVFDKRKVRFQNIAGELVLPTEALISKTTLEVKGKEVIAGNQFKRTPFMASFQSGWLAFDICTVHIYYGADSGPKLKQRVEEIETVAWYLAKRADRALGEHRAMILLGDFNIFRPKHKTMEALTRKENGFQVPEALLTKPSTPTARHYDQIAFKTKRDVLTFVNRTSDDPLCCNAGVVPLFESVFTDGQFEEYRDLVVQGCTSGGKAAGDDAKLRKVYEKWRTYQFSDHYPMWVRLETDRADEYLKRLGR